jgi:NADH-quinone oxidoreductase subunit A
MESSSPSQLAQYIPILFLLAAAVGFAGGTLLVSVLLGKFAKSSKAKDAPYECGKDPIGESGGRFSVKFYLVAMLFILFDIEVVFMYPWAVVYRDMLAEHATRNLVRRLHLRGEEKSLRLEDVKFAVAARQRRPTGRI